MLQKPLYNFWEPVWNNYYKSAGFLFCLTDYLLLVDFLLILCSFYNSIINIISLFESRNTFGEHFGKGLFEIGHIRDMVRNVSNDLFAISSWFLKINTRSSHRLWKTKAAKNPLYNLWGPVWNTYTKIQNLHFASKTTQLRLSANHVHLSMQ